MTSSRFDVVIAGAGLVGASLAVALARGGVATALVDAAPGRGEPTRAIEDDWDARIYAISPSSIRFLERIGAWRHVRSDRIAACLRMEVHGDAGSAIVFDAWESGVDALAWMVESREIGHAIEAAFAGGTPPARIDDRVQSYARTSRGLVASLSSGAALEASLLVGADGAASVIRDLAGIAIDRHDYDEAGVVANFRISESHHDTAFQWFRGDGVLAMLPLPGRRASMVWSTPAAHARALRALSPEALCDAVATACGHRLGRMQLLAPAQAFPLSRVIARDVVAPRVALVGDAGHVVHPLAGQGVNLGFGDAESLSALILGREAAQQPGDDRLLRRYRRHRAEPILAMRLATHGLHQLFSRPDPVSRGIRNTGLNLAARAPVIRSLLARHAMG